MIEQTEDRTRLLEFLRRSVRHVVKQGEPAERCGGCVYYTGERGLRCAIGGAVSLEAAEILEQRFSGKSLTFDLQFSLARELSEFVCGEIGVSWNEKNITFLKGIQRCHDTAAFENYGGVGQVGDVFISNFLGKVADFASKHDVPFDIKEYLEGAGA